MKYSIIIILMSLFQAVLSAQTESNESKFETFEHTADGKTYTMKKYYLCLLKKGSNRDHDEITAKEIQEGHMAHIGKMSSIGKLAIAGPMGDDGDLRGIFILNVPTMADAVKLVGEDPAIKSGRLKAEIHPWWGAVGTTLP